MTITLSLNSQHIEPTELADAILVIQMLVKVNRWDVDTGIEYGNMSPRETYSVAEILGILADTLHSEGS